MKIMRFALTAVLCIGLLEAAPAATSYVAQAGQTPLSPYSSWAAAASNIQDAINVTTAGDTVLVSNGVYQTGGVTNWPAGTLLTNRVAITNAITVQAFSTNPADTLIQGAWDPATNGPAAVRCVYMVNNSALIGFTLTNGATMITNVQDGYSGGVLSQSTSTMISNCVLTGNSGYWVGGGALLGTFYNCTFIGNLCVANDGGGAYAANLNNCTLTGNSARGTYGGGAWGGTLNNCTFTGNSAGHSGGGAYSATLNNCILTSNSATYGGGARASRLSSCTLSNNSSTQFGGGTMDSTLTNCTVVGNSSVWGGGTVNGTLFNCTVVGNSAQQTAGGTYTVTYYNCTIVGNSAGIQGGGDYAGNLINSIVYFNSAPSGSNWLDTIAFTNSCTVPAATNGPGNITSDPRFIANGSGYGTNHVAGNYRLSASSPCINAGTNFAWMTDTNDVRSVDLDGNPRIRYGTVDMGAYETLLKGTIFIAY